MSLCMYVQFYSSEHDKNSEKMVPVEDSTLKEGTPEYLIKEMLEEAIHPNIIEESSNSGYSTSYCWPPLNTATLGLQRYHPAQSCEHIHNVNTTAPNGFYWIDPNLGCSSDAILVYCDFTSNETCIYPNSSQVYAGIIVRHLHGGHLCSPCRTSPHPHF